MDVSTVPIPAAEQRLQLVLRFGYLNPRTGALKMMVTGAKKTS